ncbi:MAG: 23S rRNA (pseudouridine(1915)-N(3))-methyltransferase RlmH [Bacilli bacterium]
MKIKILAVGKIKEQYFKDAICEYLKRLSRFAEIEIIEINDQSVADRPSQKEIEKAKDIEAQKVLKKIKNDEHVILLDLGQKELESPQFAVFLERKLIDNGGKLLFVIGGSYGLGEALKKRSNDSISLAKMTFTHQMSRIIFLEQLYRAFKILNNEVYHK